MLTRAEYFRFNLMQLSVNILQTTKTQYTLRIMTLLLSFFHLVNTNSRSQCQLFYDWAGKVLGLDEELEDVRSRKFILSQ